MSMAGDSPSPAGRLRRLVSTASAALRLRGFNPSKCKTEAKMAMARIKLLRNKRQAALRQMRRDVAGLLEAGHHDNARIRVEHVIREQNVLAANDIIEVFCELIVARISIVAKQRECPTDLKEGISSLIYAAPRCSELPELERMRDLFEKKYGKEFVFASTELRPNSGINHLLIEKLSVKNPTGEVKLKVLKEIAKEYQVRWDPVETEQELLRPAEELLQGPRTFFEASKVPLVTTLPQQRAMLSPSKISPSQYADNGNSSGQDFRDTSSALEAAAHAAEMAAIAARAAACLAKQNAPQTNLAADSENPENQRMNCSSSQLFRNKDISSDAEAADKYEAAPHHQMDLSRTHSTNSSCRSSERETAHSYGASHHTVDDIMKGAPRIVPRNRGAVRNPRMLHTDIKFDNSDGLNSETDEGSDSESESVTSRGCPVRPPPPAPAHLRGSCSEERITTPGSHVHPKLPDYDDLAARFEALKSFRSRDAP